MQLRQDHMADLESLDRGFVEILLHVALRIDNDGARVTRPRWIRRVARQSDRTV